MGISSKEVRNTVVQEMGISSQVEVSKEIARRWAQIDPEEKKRYEELGVADKVRYNREMEHYQPSPEFLAQKASFDNANFGRDSLNDYFNYVNVNWKKVSVDRNMVNATDIQNFLWKEWCEKKSAPKKKPVKKVKPTGPFDLFKKVSVDRNMVNA